ncbi:MAG: adenylate/guanylate cyclase domain-containing protein, partial [Alphaproteobacteria bacterium]|nr:adenylate/guanylate cyclase domain-containing protein [Alphaproteobacteria bacterium]
MLTRLRRMKGAGVIVGSLTVVLAIAIVRFIDPNLTQSLRYRLFDYYVATDALTRENVPSPVAIIDIDEKSLDALGQWPWPRTVLAQLLLQLKEYGAVAIAMDVIYAEYDRTSPRLVASTNPLIPPDIQAKLAALPDNEQVMAYAMSQFPTVLGMVSRDKPANATPLPESSVRLALGGDAAPLIKRNRFEWLRSNIPEIEEQAAGRGVFSFVPDADGIIRRAPLILQVDGDKVYPSLAVELLRVLAQAPQIATVADQNGIRGVSIANPELGVKLDIPTNDEGLFWIRFGQADTVNTEGNTNRYYISAIDVLNQTVPAEKLAGKVLLLGSSASGLKDLRNTPVHPALPGVEVHANIVDNVLNGIFISAPEWFGLIEAIIIIVFGFGMVFLTRLIPFWASAPLVVMFGGLFFFISWTLFTEQEQLIDATLPSITVVAAFILVLSGNYLRESADRRFIRKAFGQYLSPDLIERLSSQPEQLKLGGEMRRMTFLFCDVQGFTTISESFKSNPQGLTHLINRLLTPLTDVILRNNGAIDKYMGDCIMAFWNAPLDNDMHAKDAAISAIAMHRALNELNEVRRNEATANNEVFNPLKVGIGINSGDAVVGNMGSEQRFDYSVLGDSVNLAARLEGQTRTYGVGVLIGEETAAELDVAMVAFVELDRIKVKGKDEA